MYCTVSDVRKALTPGGDSSNTGTAADLADPQLKDAISEAAARVDAYVGGSYTDPPDVIQFWTRDIAAYLATLTWRESKDLSENDPVRLRFIQTISMLASVAKGQLKVPLPEGSVASSDAAVVNRHPQDLFTEQEFALGNPYTVR